MQTKERYAHLDAEWVKASAVCVLEKIAAALLSGDVSDATMCLPQATRGMNGEVATNSKHRLRASYGARPSRAV